MNQQHLEFINDTITKVSTDLVKQRTEQLTVQAESEKKKLMTK